jgi:protein-S-isoprenylcysteine O-methyltransferase Ste14
MRTGPFDVFFRHRGSILVLAAAPIAVGSLERPFLWTDAAFGLALLALGALLRLFAIRRIGKRARVAKPGATRLLCLGPYAHTRNPLYVANLCITAGAGLLAGLREWALLPTAFVFFVYQLVVLAEERTLAAMFSEAFERYRERVPRWLPRLTAAEPIVTDPEAIWSWREVLVREAPALLGVAGLGAVLVYIGLAGPGVAPAVSALRALAARLSLSLPVLVVSLVALSALVEAAFTFFRRRRHALRKQWWAKEIARVGAPQPAPDAAPASADAPR